MPLAGSGPVVRSSDINSSSISMAAALEEIKEEPKESKEESVVDLTPEEKPLFQIDFLPKQEIISIPHEVILACLRHPNPKLIDLLLNVELNEFKEQSEMFYAIATRKVLARLEDSVVGNQKKIILIQLSKNPEVEDLIRLLREAEYYAQKELKDQQDLKEKEEGAVSEEVEDASREYANSYLAGIFAGLSALPGRVWSYGGRQYRIVNNEHQETWVHEVSQDRKEEKSLRADAFQEKMAKNIESILTRYAKDYKEAFIQRCSDHFNNQVVSSDILKDYLEKEELRVRKTHEELAYQYKEIQERGTLEIQQILKRENFLKSWLAESGELPQEFQVLLNPKSITDSFFFSYLNRNTLNASGESYLFHAVESSLSISTIQRLLEEYERMGKNPLEMRDVHGNNLLHLVAARASHDLEAHLILKELIEVAFRVEKKRLHSAPIEEKMPLCFKILINSKIAVPEIQMAMQDLKCQFEFQSNNADRVKAGEKINECFYGRQSRLFIADHVADILKVFFENLDTQLTNNDPKTRYTSLAIQYDQKILEQVNETMFICFKAPNNDGHTPISLFFELDRGIYFSRLVSTVPAFMIKDMMGHAGFKTKLIGHLISYKAVLNEMISGEKTQWLLSYALHSNFTTPKKQLQNDMRALYTHFDDPGKCPKNTHENRLLTRLKHVQMLELMILLGLVKPDNQNLIWLLKGMLEEGERFLAWYCSNHSKFYDPIKELVSAEMAILRVKNIQLEARNAQLEARNAQLETMYTATAERVGQLEQRLEQKEKEQQAVLNNLVEQLKKLETEMLALKTAEVRELSV